MSAFESIKRGLTEAIAYTKGEKTGSRVHKVGVPKNDEKEKRRDVEN